MNDYHYTRRRLADAVRRGDRVTAKRLTKKAMAAQMKLFSAAPKQPAPEGAPFDDFDKLPL